MPSPCHHNCLLTMVYLSILTWNTSCGTKQDANSKPNPSSRSFVSSEFQQTTVLQLPLPERSALVRDDSVDPYVLNAIHLKLWTAETCEERIFIEKKLRYRDGWNFESQLSPHCDHYLMIKIGHDETSLVDIGEKKIDPVGPHLTSVYLQNRGVTLVEADSLASLPSVRVRIPLEATDWGISQGFQDFNP